MDIIFVQIVFSIILFFLINWIGKHSYSIGYMEISLFIKTEEAPAFNFLVRVLSPIVYIIIISALLYYFGLDKYVWNIFLVNVYYIAFRLLFNIITNRGLLLNWYRQVLYWSAIILFSYLTYEKLIKVKTNIFPDFSTVSNELWIIILIFLFQVFNNIRLSNEGVIKRKHNYLKSRYFYFNGLYGKLIKEITKNEALEVVVFSILIYEDFNRPKVIRLIENINHRISKKEHTLGVMQVKSERLISDLESVRLGTEKVVNAYRTYLNKLENGNTKFYRYQAYSEIIANYNGGDSYQFEIINLINEIKENFYKTTKDTLEPANKNAL